MKWEPVGGERTSGLDKANYMPVAETNDCLKNGFQRGLQKVDRVPLNNRHKCNKYFFYVYIV